MKRGAPAIPGGGAFDLAHFIHDARPRPQAAATGFRVRMRPLTTSSISCRSMGKSGSFSLGELATRDRRGERAVSG